MTAPSALTREIAHALKPFADVLADYAPQEDDSFKIWVDAPKLTLGDLRRLSAILSLLPAQAVGEGEREVTILDDKQQRRSVFDIAREIIADGDAFGARAHHSTSILTRNVLEKLLNIAVCALPSLPAPHPRWKPNDKSDRHPQAIEEWDCRNDPVGEALERSRRRLNVAGDYDDPRAPDQMTLVLRQDITRLMHDWIHKNAVFEIWCKEREDARASVLPSPPAEPSGEMVEAEREACAKIADERADALSFSGGANTTMSIPCRRIASDIRARAALSSAGEKK